MLFYLWLLAAICSGLVVGVVFTFKYAKARKKRAILPALAVLAGVGLLRIVTNKWWMDTYWQSGKFHLIAIDTRSQMTLISEDSPLSLVGPTIFAVGSDSAHIVLKQHPALNLGATSFDRSITRYFVVDRNKRVRGPLDEKQFDQLAASLQLPQFTEVFDDLQ